MGVGSLPTPTLLAASGITAPTSRSQLRSHTYLFFVLSHGFSRKRETVRSLGLYTLLATKIIRLQSWTKSLGTNLHLWRFYRTRQTNSYARIHLHLFRPSDPSPPPSYNVGHVYTLFFQHCIGGEGGGEVKVTRFEPDNSVLKTQKVNAITQMSQRILSTIV